TVRSTACCAAATWPTSRWPPAAACACWQRPAANNPPAASRSCAAVCTAASVAAAPGWNGTCCPAALPTPSATRRSPFAGLERDEYHHGDTEDTEGTRRGLRQSVSLPWPSALIPHC